MTEKRLADIRRRADARLKKNREAVLACRTQRELLQTVAQLQKAEWYRGFSAGRRGTAPPDDGDWLGA